MNDDRPKWLRGTIGFILGFWALLLSLAACLALTINIADAILPGDGLPILPGSILLLISLTVAIIVTVRFVKYQDAFMAKYSKNTNMIVMVVLIILFIVFVPTPFTYAVF
jgi:hypothetical protein